MIKHNKSRSVQQHFRQRHHDSCSDANISILEKGLFNNPESIVDTYEDRWVLCLETLEIN